MQIIKERRKEMNADNTPAQMQDNDYTNSSVPQSARCSNITMLMIMLGFTFFSASMWAGQQLANGLDFNGFVGALVLGSLILSVYTGALGFIGAKTGLSLDLLAKKSFGRRGSYLPSAMIAFTQAGWFGVGLAMFAFPVEKYIIHGGDVVVYGLVIAAGICMTASAYFGIKSLTIVSYIAVPAVAILGGAAMCMAISQGEGTIVEQFSVSSGKLSVITGSALVIGSFISGGTATPNFSRFAKNSTSGFWTTVTAFSIGNSLMFCFGAVSSIFVGGGANDIFDVMIKLGLFWSAFIVLGLNIWTTNDNAIYSTGLGLSNITGYSKKSMVLISGTLGTVLAVWLYNNFCPFLGLLNATLPPIGAIIVMSFLMEKEKYADGADMEIEDINPGAVAGLVIGAVVANLFPYGVASINGMFVACVCYYLGKKLK